MKSLSIVVVSALCLVLTACGLGPLIKRSMMLKPSLATLSSVKYHSNSLLKKLKGKLSKSELNSLSAFLLTIKDQKLLTKVLSAIDQSENNNKLLTKVKSILREFKKDNSNCEL